MAARFAIATAAGTTSRPLWVCGGPPARTRFATSNKTKTHSTAAANTRSLCLRRNFIRISSPRVSTTTRTSGHQADFETTLMGILKLERWSNARRLPRRWGTQEVMQVQLAAPTRRNMFAGRLVTMYGPAINRVDVGQERSQPEHCGGRSYWGLLLQLPATQPQLRGRRSARLRRVSINCHLGVQRKGEHQNARDEQERAPTHGIHGPVGWRQGRHVQSNYTSESEFRERQLR